MDKEGKHLHLFFRLANARSVDAMHKFFIHLFKKEVTNDREDKPRSQHILQEPLNGRFPDCVNYVKNAHAGSHALEPKILDPEPIIYPTSGEDPDAPPKKVDYKSQIIEDIRHGATFDWLFKNYTRFMFDNEPKVKRIYDEMKKRGMVKYQPLAGGAPRYETQEAKETQAVQGALSGIEKMLATFGF